MKQNTYQINDRDAAKLVAFMTEASEPRWRRPEEIMTVTVEPGFAMLMEKINADPYVFLLPNTIVSFESDAGSGTDLLRSRMHARLFFTKTVEDYKASAAFKSADQVQSPAAGAEGAHDLVIQPIYPMKGGNSAKPEAAEADGAGAPGSTMGSPVTFGAPNVRHPFSEYCLADAVQMAKGIASLWKETVNSLVEARVLIQRSAENSGHNWITGAVALDVLDAAIDGVDLKVINRIIPETEPGENLAQKLRTRAADAVASYVYAHDCLETRHLDTANPEGLPDSHFFDNERIAENGMMTALSMLPDDAITAILAEHNAKDHDGSTYEVTSVSKVRAWAVLNVKAGPSFRSAEGPTRKSTRSMHL